MSYWFDTDVQFLGRRGIAKQENEVLVWRLGKMKKTLLILLAVCLSAAVSFGAIRSFENTLGDNEWFQAFNWSGQAIPTASDDAYIESDYALIEPGDNISVNSVVIAPNPSFSDPSRLVMDGGTLNSTGRFAINMYPGTAANTGIFDLNDGNVSAGGLLQIGKNGNTNSIMNVSAGSFTTTGSLEFGAGQLNITGGSVDVGGIKLSSWGNSATLYMEPGAVFTVSGDVETWIFNRLGGPKFNNSLGGGADTWALDYNVRNAGKTTLTVVPEPATLALLGIGGVLLRKKRS